MNQEDEFDFDTEFVTYDDVERIIRRARMERNAALGRAIRFGVLAVAGALGRLTRAIGEALQLRALAMLDDRELAALGLDRGDIPALVFGWGTAPPTLVLTDIEAIPDRSDRIAA